MLLALPIALGRRCRWPWQATLAVMIALRICLHVYLGWDCLFVVPWIIGAVVLYRWCPLLWPFMLGHGLFDLLQTLQTYGGRAASVTGRIGGFGDTGPVINSRSALSSAPAGYRSHER